MPFYQKINPKTTEGRRTLDRLINLRKIIKQQIPQRTLDETLLLATWNIRDFDKSAYGSRLDEAIYYIAEIIASFDLVAIQEVYQDLEGLERVMKVLGKHWEYICTDATMGRRGNKERMAFVYDQRKVSFGGIAGELVLPPIKDNSGEYHPVTQLWRTPFMVGFRCGWAKFILTTVHILWGKEGKNSAERVAEIHQVAEFLKKRTKDETTWSQNMILLGDFNIFGTTDETFQQLTNAGFVVPEELLEFRSNASQTRHYDQIAFRTRPGSLTMTGKAGVFNFFDVVFQESDKDIYIPYMENYEMTNEGTPRSDKSKRNYYQTYWRTHQMSDHLPMWVELQIDYSDQYLINKLRSE
ncbi:MAG: endonuclease/exonuclease/phosphatase family protein [Sphaerospermopsis sp. SIO1G2]|nr:endonuclease/exonuclease/phosphatase family protein [Sphaerospermopsis sp. SIO1G2]